MSAAPETEYYGMTILVDHEAHNFITLLSLFMLSVFFLQTCLSAGETNRLFAGWRAQNPTATRTRPRRRNSVRTFPVPDHLRGTDMNVLRSLSYAHLRQVCDSKPLSRPYPIAALKLHFDLVPKSMQVVFAGCANGKHRKPAVTFECQAIRRRPAAGALPGPEQLCLRSFWGVDSSFIEKGIYSREQKGGSSYSRNREDTIPTTPQTSTSVPTQHNCIDELFEGLSMSSSRASPIMLAASTPVAEATTTNTRTAAAGKEDGEGNPSWLDEHYQFSSELPLLDEYFPAVFVISKAPTSSIQHTALEDSIAMDTAAALIYIINGTKGEKVGGSMVLEDEAKLKGSNPAAATTYFELSSMAKIAVSSNTNKWYALQPVFGLERDEVTGNNEESGFGEISSCVVCMDRRRNALFLPCRHIVVCDECASRVHVCPVCKLKFTSLVRLKTAWDEHSSGM